MFSVLGFHLVSTFSYSVTEIYWENSVVAEHRILFSANDRHGPSDIIYATLLPYQSVRIRGLSALVF